jgi:hypothetical protein
VRIGIAFAKSVADAQCRADKKAGRQTGMSRNISALVVRRMRALLMFLAAALSLTTTPAFAQETSDLAKQAQNPIASLISVPFQNNFNFDAGSKEDLQNVLNIQPVIPFQISDRWNLITRTIVPVIHQPELGPGIGNVSGLGDIQFSTFLSPVSPRGVVWGVGTILSLPTATDDLLGADKLGIGPTGVALASHGRWLIGTLVNNVFSIAGASDRGDVNQMLVQPFVNYNMAGGWYFVSSPIVTANWKADNDQRWTVPMGGGLGRIFRVAKQALNTHLQAFYDVEHPDGAARWSLRLQTQLLFPK